MKPQPGESHPSNTSGAIAWWVATIVVALILFLMALSDDVYNLTSPPGPFQILLRKTYSIVAFALVGWLFARALTASGKRSSILTVAVCIAAYSGLIEVGQQLGTSQESLGWHLFDVACGFIGGVIGSLPARRTRTPAIK